MSRQSKQPQEQQHPKRTPGFLRVNLPKIAAAGSGQLTIAAVTGYISYGHVKALTMALGEPEKYANVWPLGVDGMVVACSVMVLTAKRDKAAAKAGVALGIAQSVAANLAYGWTDVNGKLGWPAHAAGAAWSALIALGFAITCISLERWIAGLVADWRDAHRGVAGHAVRVTPAAPALETTPVVAPGAASPAAVEPVPAEPVTAPETPAPRPLPTPEPVKASTPTPAPAAPKPAAKAPVVPQQQKQQPEDGQPRTCCAAHRALDSGTKLDREMAAGVWAGHQASHGRDLGAGALEKVFGMGTKPARLLRDELKAYPGSPSGAEPGLTGAGVVSPSAPGSATPAQPGPAPALNPGSPAPAHPGSDPARTYPGSTEPGAATPARTNPGSTPAQPGTGPARSGEPGLSEMAEPGQPVLAGSGAKA